MFPKEMFESTDLPNSFEDLRGDKPNHILKTKPFYSGIRLSYHLWKGNVEHYFRGDYALNVKEYISKGSTQNSIYI